MQRYTGNGSFDVVVIGGGITGAAVAYEAASRGLRVALFERGDFAEATSAASSKLIHGGLRYLANHEYRLVRESLRERRTLENIAPNFVYPLAFLLPHYRGSIRNSRGFIKLGLTLYDLLAFDKGRTWEAAKRIPGHQSLSAREALARQPRLQPAGLTGASVFYDCLSIAPERLALAFVKSAVHHGARVANYARVAGFLCDADQSTIQGVEVHDRIDRQTYRVQAAVTINCAGPWADSVLALAPGQTGREHLRRSEGIHIITRPIINPDCAMSAMTAGNRHCFLIPWRGHTLIGTTDKAYHGHPDDYRVTRASIQELLDTVNATFADLHLTWDDVRHTYGGLRPLVERQTAETYKASRQYEISDHRHNGRRNLLTVEGGKWTTSRHLAEKVVDRLAQATTLAPGHSISARQYLQGCAINDMHTHIRRLTKGHPDFEAGTIETLGRLYGTDCEAVLALAHTNPALAVRINQDGELPAQAVYAVRHEMAHSLLDIVLRRTGIATLGNPGEAVLKQVAATVAPELGWDNGHIADEVQAAMDFLSLPAL